MLTNVTPRVNALDYIDLVCVTYHGQTVSITNLILMICVIFVVWQKEKKEGNVSLINDE